jgi:hypothetical protein
VLFMIAIQIPDRANRKNIGKQFAENVFYQ